MSVIPLTVFLSLGLVLVFVLLFLREQRRRPFASAERDSLLPLAEEQPLVQPATPGASSRPVGVSSLPSSDPAHDDDHDHASGHCGCRMGERPPCPDCAHRQAVVAAS